MADIDALIASTPSQIQNNALRSAQIAQDQQKIADNALSVQENQAGTNALRQIYADPNSRDPRTGMPTPGALGPLAQASPEMYMNYMNTVSKIQDSQSRAGLTNFKLRNDQNQIMIDYAAKPALEYEQELQDKGIPPDQRKIMVQQKYSQYVNDIAAKWGFSDNIKNTALGVDVDSLPQRVEMNQFRNKNIENGWQKETDYGKNPPVDYYHNKFLNINTDISQKAPYTPTGIGKLEGAAEAGPWIDQTPNGPVLIQYNPSTQRFSKDGQDYTPQNPKKLGGKESSEQKPPAFGSENDLMNRWREDFVTKNKRQPTTDEIAEEKQELTKSTRPVGRQLAQVTQRLMIGANEVNKAVTSMTQLPMGTTLGVFGGAQAALGKDLTDNLRKALANEATPESAQVLKTLSNGISRGLAILESGGSAQGLVGLASQLQSDIPAKGDSGLAIAAKYADMRQIVEAATEVLDANQDIGNDQKALLKNISASVKKAIPFTASDVARLIGNPSDEKLAQFAEKAGLTKKQESETGDLLKKKFNSNDEALEQLLPGKQGTLTDGSVWKRDKQGVLHQVSGPTQ